ncbi:MAG: energy transducer TonB [Chryseolinea sp.]
MKNKPDLSDDEIRGFMDFDKLLNARNQALPFIGRTKLLVALGVVMISSGIWLYFHMSHPIPDNPVSNKSSQASLPNDPFVVHSDSLTKLILDSVSMPVLKNRMPMRSNKLSKSGKIRSQPADSVVTNSSLYDKSREPLKDSYVEAEPQNGYADFYKYLNDNLRYPVETIKDSIQGVETISFTINAHGNMENILVRQSLGKSFDLEAVRVIQQIPAWKPAVLNGKAVASQISIPLTFHMERLKK